MAGGSAQAAGRGPAYRAAVLWCAAVICAPQAARSWEFRLWPLVDVSVSHGQRRVAALGPLFEWERSGAQSSLVFRPLLWWRRTVSGQGEFAILYPLTVARWGAGGATLQIGGLLSYTWERAASERPQPKRRRMILFPLVFYHEDYGAGRRLSVLPFYADLRDFFGFARLRAVAFPLYLRVDEGVRQRTWTPFPFFYRLSGAAGRGWGLWPLFGWRDLGAERSRFVLWPLYAERIAHPGTPQELRSRLLGPFWRVQGPDIDTHAWAGPFLVHTIDRRRGRDTWSFPWPLWLVERDASSRRITSIRFWPLWQDRRGEGFRSRFWAWPVYRHRVWRDDEAWRERRDIFLTLARYERERTPARNRRLITAFPLLRDEQTEDRRHMQAPALFDALAPHNALISEIWGPLWAVWTYHREGDLPPRWSALWGMFAAGEDGLRLPVELRRSMSLSQSENP